MSIDAVALLRISKLAPPTTAYGVAYHVAHRGDASLLYTMNRLRDMPVDEHSLALRQILGAELDAHDDPRGILLFPDAYEPKGQTYDEIVNEVATAATWAPKVDADHVPARYANAAVGTHEALVAKMIAAMGRDDATALDMTAHVNLTVIDATNGREDVVRGYEETIANIATAMGEGFTALYEASLRKNVDDDRARQAEHHARSNQLASRARSGEPLVSSSEMSAFLQSDAARAAMNALDPSILEALSKELEGIDVETLPDDDLAKQLAKMLKK